MQEGVSPACSASRAGRNTEHRYIFLVCELKSFAIQPRYCIHHSRMSLSLHTVRPSEGSPHTHTIIFLHGRDSEAEEFASGFSEFEASGPDDDRTLTPLSPIIRWSFPQANALRSERFDTNMSQWFGLWSLEALQERSELQVPSLQSSVGRVIKTIKEEKRLSCVHFGLPQAYGRSWPQGTRGTLCRWQRRVCRSLRILQLAPLADEVTSIIRETFRSS